MSVEIENNPIQESSTAASPRHQILVVGVGSIGERHVRCLLATSRARISICDVNRVLRDEVCGRYAIERSYDNVHSALADSFDAAVIAVPANLHVAIASQALRNGLHLMIEKPLSVSMSGVTELLELAAVHNRVITIGYVFRAHPSLAAMKRAIDSGIFGRPLQVVAVSGQPFATFRPAYRQTYFASRDLGGGALQDAMTHLINAGEWLAGPVDRVVADLDHRSLDGVDVEDVVHVLTRQGNVLGSYSLNQFQAANEVTITVTCERATVRFENHRHRWRTMIDPDGKWHDETIDKLDRDAWFTYQATAFLDSIDTGSPPLCSLNEGIQSLRVNLAAMNSVISGSWQELTAQVASPCQLL